MSGNMGNSGTKSILLALDFDHTVVDSNTDVEIQDLAIDGEIPANIRQLYSKKCWTDFMQAVFELLHRQGRKEEEYKRYIVRLPLAPGMKDLLSSAAQSDRIESIIISDSNTLFIQWILDHQELSVNSIFSNPAQFDSEGCLRISYHHVQDWCEISTKNLCKGHILQEYIKQREKAGVKFEKVVYVGDGKNDLCAATRLKKQDILCARNGFAMAAVLNSEKKIPLKAKTVFYSSGVDILPYLDIQPNLTPPGATET